ncbi:MAG: ATP phosphoribosyltransferase regulatory subunit [Pyrinomonadaceae bacterium]
MTEPLSKVPNGMRYYFGSEARLRRRVEDAAMTVFDGWSYEEISTPTVDYYALFERGMGAREASRAFRFTDTDGRLLALRPDVTSSVARSAATLFADRARPLRMCYAATVFRQTPRTHAEARRESTQLGCELIGSRSAEADIEMLLIATEVLEKLNLGRECCITLSSVEIFNGVAENLSLDAEARETMRRLIDLKDAAELERFLAPFAPAPDERAAFARLTRLSGKREVLAEARRVITNPRSIAALDHLEKLWSVIDSLGYADVFEIDLGDVSGLDYYTGLIFKIYIAGAGARVGRGGRYDSLAANFGRTEPATGFVLELDGITDVLARRSDSHDAPNTHNGNHAADNTTHLETEDTTALFLEAQKHRARGQRVLLNK